MRLSLVAYTVASVADEDYTGYELSANLLSAFKQLSLIGVYNYGVFDKAQIKQTTLLLEAVWASLT